MTHPTADYIPVAGLEVAPALYELAESVLCPRAGIAPDTLWQALANLVTNFTGRNRELLARRTQLQDQLDAYHREHPGQPDPAELEAFLREIGYLVDQPKAATIRTENVDEEIARIAGPQLVVPVLNARYAINAANARWGSLYDALYGTDVIPGTPAPGGYDPARGNQVIAWSRALLDEIAPLSRARHADVTGYQITAEGELEATVAGTQVTLEHPERFRGWRGERNNPSALLLRNNGLHAIIDIDRNGAVGATDAAGINDVRLEAAVSTIIDFEDSVAAVDGEDKALGYANWHGLSTGELAVEMSKGTHTFTRSLADDLTFTSTKGELRLHGRSLLLVRNVGHLMTTPAVLADGEEIFEGLLDALFTVLAALPGLDADNPRRNSRTGSIYVVKPKQHGPEEVAFTNDLFAAVEDALNLPRFTVKIGVMDEERRTSVNLDACIMAVADRLAFINTGFLDRTGDEIHSSMEAGPMERKAAMQTAPWKQAYEDNNVDTGLDRGLPGRAQIGKGMWAMTDLMADMVAKKIGQPREGANTAWVPSPTAATLHATHYHLVDVAGVQAELRSRGRRDTLANLLTVPVNNRSYSDAERREEMDNNCQSILGYVVRWVEQGIGCSRVPDIHDVALMEDRATLRISSQILANWIRHEVVSAEEVIDSLERMAVLVDRQNADDPAYRPMAADFEASLGFQAAKDLILQGTTQPAGYTEPILHARRREFKARNSL